MTSHIYLYDSSFERHPFGERLADMLRSQEDKATKLPENATYLDTLSARERELVEHVITVVNTGKRPLEDIFSKLDDETRTTLVELLTSTPEKSHTLELQLAAYLEAHPELQQTIAQESEAFKQETSDILEMLRGLPEAVWETVKKVGSLPIELFRQLPLPVKIALGLVALTGSVYMALSLLQMGNLATLTPMFNAMGSWLELPSLSVITPDIIGEAADIISNAPSL